MPQYIVPRHVPLTRTIRRGNPRDKIDGDRASTSCCEVAARFQLPDQFMLFNYMHEGKFMPLTVRKNLLERLLLVSSGSCRRDFGNRLLKNIINSRVIKYRFCNDFGKKLRGFISLCKKIKTILAAKL